MNNKDLISNIRNSLNNELPGRQAQLKMSASAVRSGYLVAPPEASRAGVLALFYPKKADWHIVLIERASSNPNDRHRGQISFPGGRFEKDDVHLANTAIRETEEEVGVKAKDIHLLGPLTDLYIPVSNFRVDPFVGFTETTPRFVPQEEEVHGILEVPVSELMNPDNLKIKNLVIREGFVLKDVPYFDLLGKTVWGATAMMLSELIDIIK